MKELKLLKEKNNELYISLNDLLLKNKLFDSFFFFFLKIRNQIKLKKKKKKKESNNLFFNSFFNYSMNSFLLKKKKEFIFKKKKKKIKKIKININYYLFNLFFLFFKYKFFFFFISKNLYSKKKNLYLFLILIKNKINLLKIFNKNLKLMETNFLLKNDSDLFFYKFLMKNTFYKKYSSLETYKKIKLIDLQKSEPFFINQRLYVKTFKILNKYLKKKDVHEHLKIIYRSDIKTRKIKRKINKYNVERKSKKNIIRIQKIINTFKKLSKVNKSKEKFLYNTFLKKYINYIFFLIANNNNKIKNKHLFKSYFSLLKKRNKFFFSFFFNKKKKKKREKKFFINFFLLKKLIKNQKNIKKKKKRLIVKKTKYIMNKKINELKKVLNKKKKKRLIKILSIKLNFFSDYKSIKKLNEKRKNKKIKKIKRLIKIIKKKNKNLNKNIIKINNLLNNLIESKKKNVYINNIKRHNLYLPQVYRNLNLNKSLNNIIEKSSLKNIKYLYFFSYKILNQKKISIYKKKDYTLIKVNYYRTKNNLFITVSYNKNDNNKVYFKGSTRGYSKNLLSNLKKNKPEDYKNKYIIKQYQKFSYNIMNKLTINSIMSTKTKLKKLLKINKLLSLNNLLKKKYDLSYDYKSKNLFLFSSLDKYEYNFEKVSHWDAELYNPRAYVKKNDTTGDSHYDFIVSGDIYQIKDENLNFFVSLYSSYGYNLNKMFFKKSIAHNGCRKRKKKRN